jgi:aldehyde dehydrogenase (NAD+)
MNFNGLLKRQKDYFYTGKTRAYQSRIDALKTLKKAIKKYENRIMEALGTDLGKSAFEAYATEVGFTLNSINHTISNLKNWMKDEKVSLPIHQVGSKAYSIHEPYGVVLIIAPFNYPFQLLIEPLIGAIAAGNTAIIKPSEYTEETTQVMKDMFEEFFDERFIKLVEGEREEVSELIHMPFDYIFFTGSVPVGKVVMKAASENLVPITLELGGKSPAIVHHDANLETTAKRIIWGKMLNAGQTCIAPDYILVHESVRDELQELMIKVLHEFFSENPKLSPDYGRIVNEKHFDRLVSLINQEKVITGGYYDKEALFIAPTLMTDVQLTDEIMRDEIFGPILPILTYHKVDDAIKVIRTFDKPLALYIFSETEGIQKIFIENISFGGGCINDTISHVASVELPFGGVGSSGIGRYHGVHSFKTFSNQKSVLKKTTKFSLKMIFPPYKNNLKWIRKILG